MSGSGFKAAVLWSSGFKGGWETTPALDLRVLVRKNKNMINFSELVLNYELHSGTVWFS